MSLEEVMREVRTLTLDEQKSLIKLLVDEITAPQIPTKKRSLMELEGLGADIWQGIDAQEYVNQLRDEWDDES